MTSEKMTIWGAWINYSNKLEVVSAEVEVRAKTVKLPRRVDSHGAFAYRTVIPLAEVYQTAEEAVAALHFNYTRKLAVARRAVEANAESLEQIEAWKSNYGQGR